MVNTITSIPGMNASFFDVSAKSNGEKYRVFVGASGYYETTEQLPIIFVLDGNYRFGTAMETSRSLWLESYIPAALVVGIGYVVDDFKAVGVKRERDYVVDDHTFAQNSAQQFLDFIMFELKPIFENSSEVSIDPDDCTIIGHSYGGLFATWSLLTQPDSFKRYISISPSLWRIKPRLPDLLGGFNRLDDQKYLYSTAGELEGPQHKAEMLSRMESNNHPFVGDAKAEMNMRIDGGGAHDIPRDLEEFETSLGLKDLALLRNLCEIQPNESHNTIVSGAISRGLRHVFGHS